MSDADPRKLCAQFGAAFLPPLAGSRVGIAIQTLGRRPLNGMRLEPAGSACGWYLWAGEELSTADDFFEPLCVEHLPQRCPGALPFLALPPGWRFLTDGEYVDVWFDPALLERPGPPAS